MSQFLFYCRISKAAADFLHLAAFGIAPQALPA
jgi:hypothetical protein